MKWRLVLLLSLQAICSTAYRSFEISSKINLVRFTNFKPDSIVRCIELHSTRTPIPDSRVEQELQQLFYRQAVQGNTHSSKDFKYEHNGDHLKDRKIIEVATTLISGVPVEIVIDKKLRMANFMSVKGDESVNVKLSSGEETVIDYSQVITVWDTLAEEDWPTDQESWAKVFTEAMELVRIMSPRKSDLEEFYNIVSNLRTKELSMDSTDLSVYIFQERKLAEWMNPVDEIESSRVMIPSAAQRYLSALLLFGDDHHFKRAASRRTWPEDAMVDDDSLLQIGTKEHIRMAEAGLVTYVMEGGYKALKPNLAAFRQSEIFSDYYHQRRQTSSVSGINGRDIFRAPCITRIQRAIELYARQSAKVQAPSLVKMVLRKLDKDVSPAGARSILIDMGVAFASRSTAQDLKSTMAAALASNNTSAASNGSQTLGYLAGITPWTADVLSAGKQLQEESMRRRQAIADFPVAKMGKRGFEAKTDLRACATEHPVFCIDSEQAAFLDDAYSLSPETGEIFVHIADVRQLLRRSPTLLEVARERLQSQFLPTGPVHMLPPVALNALSLSQTQPNEVITIALSIDAESGELLGYRLFPAIIPPVTALSIGQTNAILDAFDADAEQTGDVEEQRAPRLLSALKTRGAAKKTVPAPKKQEQSAALVGFSPQLLADLRQLKGLVSVICDKNEWLADQQQGKQRYQLSVGRRDQVATITARDSTGAFQLINTLLALSSNSSHHFCTQSNQLSVPILWENRDSRRPEVMRRFASQPLRSYISLLQQQQVRAALRLEEPLRRRDCAMAVAHHNNKRKEISSVLSEGRDVLAFEAFQEFVNDKVRAQHDGELTEDIDVAALDITLQGKALGIGGNLRILPFNIKGYVSCNLEKDQDVTVRLKKLFPNTRSAAFDIV